MDGKLLITCFITGIVGDSILQFLQYRGVEMGLKEYFEQHGIVESLFIASSVLVSTYILYNTVFGFKFSYLGLAVFGFLVDICYRYLNVLPSLKGMYKFPVVQVSLIAGSFCAVLPYFIYKNFVY